jgi:hypothetical protein
MAGGPGAPHAAASQVEAADGAEGLEEGEVEARAASAVHDSQIPSACSGQLDGGRDEPAKAPEPEVVWFGETRQLKSGVHA